MLDEITKKLGNFLYNIELLIHDHKIEKDGEIILYFDTSNVQRAIAGLYNFYPKAAGFDREAFDSEETLVDCLASSGNLGSINLLPPHKAELFNRLKFKLGLGDDLQPALKAQQFLKDTNFFDEDYWKGVSSEIANLFAYLKSSSELNEAEINWNEILEKFSEEEGNALKINQMIDTEKAKGFFKTIQSLSPWHLRLKELIDQKRIIINSSDDNNGNEIKYAEILGSQIFVDVKNIFNTIRPDPKKSINNLTDAICISILINKIDRFKETKKQIPRFYTSSGVSKIFVDDDDNVERYERLDDNTKNLVLKIKKKLNYAKTSQGKPISILRTEDYFIFKAIFNHLKKDEQLKELEKWKVEGTLLVEFCENLFNERIYFSKKNDIKKIVGNLDDIWKSIIERTRENFFLNIWLKSDAPKDLYRRITDTISAFKEVMDKGETLFEGTISASLELTDNKIDKGVETFEIIKSLSQKLESECEELPKITFLKTGNLSQKLFNYFPFYRYSFPANLHDDIVASVKGVIDNKEARDNILNDYINLWETTNPPSLKKLVVVCATLYATNLKEEIYNLLKNHHNSLPHFSLNILLSELIYVLPKNSEKAKVKAMIKALENMFITENDKKNKYNLAIGLAYLYYCWWRNEGGHSLWCSILSTFEKQKARKAQDLMDKAVEFAKIAYEMWDDTSKVEMEEAYALNLYLYFLVRNNRTDEETRNSTSKYEQALLGYKANHLDKWMFRYDDTLALYFCKEACLAKTRRDWRRNIDDAREYIEKAKSVAPNDETVIKNDSRIQLVEDKGFIKTDLNQLKEFSLV